MAKGADEYVQAGGERWLGWARARLRGLKGLRQDLKIPSLSKAYKVAGSTIRVRAAEWGDNIWILSPALGGFVATLYARKLSPSTVKTFASGRSPALLPFGRSAWEPLGVSGVTSLTGRPAAQGSSTRHPHSSSTAYLLDRANTSFGSSGASYAALGAFVHSYTAGGATASETLEISTAGSVYRLVGGVRTLVAASGDALVGDAASFTVSSDGRSLVVYDTVDLAYNFAVDLALPTPVAVTAVVDGPYGSQRLYTSQVRTVTGGDPENTVSTEVRDESTTLSASYPVARSVSASGEAKVVTVAHARAFSFDQTLVRNDIPITSLPQLIGFGTGTYLTSDRETYTVQLPGGASREFVVHEESAGGDASYTQTYDGVNSTYTQPGEWTAPRFETSGVLSIIYADASVPVVVYEYSSTRTDYTPTGTITPNLGTPQIDYTTTVTTRLEVGAIVGSTVHLLVSEESTEAGGSGTEAIPSGFNISFSPGTTVVDQTTDVEDNPFPVASRLVYEFGHDTSLPSRYSAATKDADKWMVSRTSDAFEFKLWEGGVDATSAYLSYLSESVLPVGGPDQEVIDDAQSIIDIAEGILADPVALQSLADGLFGGSVVAATAFLDGIIATNQAAIDEENAKVGTPDPDAALIVTNPELFEIRASGLTYV